MKIKIKDVPYFKKVISLCTQLINKSRPESVEGCLFFSLKNNELSITVGSIGSHLLKVKVEVESNDTGEFSVLASLISCLKAVPTNEIVLSVTKDVLNITAPSFGTQSKPLHNSGSLNENLTYMAEEEPVNYHQIQGSSTIGSGFKSVSSFLSKNKVIAVNKRKDDPYIEVIGDGDLGYICYRDYISSEEQFSFSFDSYYTSYIQQLGEVLSIGVGTNNVIEFSSSMGSLYVYNQGEVKTGVYENIYQIMAMKACNPALKILSKDLRSAVQWQSYGLDDLKPLSLSLDSKDRFSIKGVSIEASSLSLISNNNSFKEVSISFKALEKALACINTEEIVIEQREIEIDDEDPLIITSISTSGYKGSKTTSLIFEQVMN